jgi:hypothetical protein
LHAFRSSTADLTISRVHYDRARRSIHHISISATILQEHQPLILVAGRYFAEHGCVSFFLTRCSYAWDLQEHTLDESAPRGTGPQHHWSGVFGTADSLNATQSKPASRPFPSHATDRNRSEFGEHLVPPDAGYGPFSNFGTNVGVGPSPPFLTFPGSEFELSQAYGVSSDTVQPAVHQQYALQGVIHHMLPVRMPLQGLSGSADVSAAAFRQEGSAPYDVLHPTPFPMVAQLHGVQAGFPQIVPNGMPHQGYVDPADMSASAFAQTGSHVPLATPIPTARQQPGRQASFQPMPSNDMSLQEIVSPADISALGVPHTGSAAPRAEGNPVACEHPGCSATFGRKAEMRRHLTTAHRRGPTVRCMFCHYDCPRIDKVRSHMRTMHAEGWRKLMGRSA